MQDLKNLSRNKYASRSGINLFKRGNRKILPSESPLPFRLPLPEGKKRQQLKLILLFIAAVLALTPVCITLFRKSAETAKTVLATLNRPPAAAPQPREPQPGPFARAASLLDTATDTAGALTARTPEGDTIHYTIRGELQQKVHGFLAENQVPYGVFVAIEPSSGRILALTSYSAADPAWTRNAYLDLYPMASLFKIITASAALEQKKITPDTVIEFRGRSCSESPRYWETSPRGRNSRIDLTSAMARSINPVYGRVASDIAGKESVMECADRFGFNQQLLPGTLTKESRAGEPKSSHELMLMGAGLDHEVKISPLHAAVIMAAIANNGTMMSPSLTEQVTTARGENRDMFEAKELRRLVTPETASSLTRMLSTTVTSGTSRRAFHDRRGRPKLNVEVAAKTGSISGTDPRGHYSWFAAYAPARNPRIALVALVINQDRWKIKSSQVGEQALQVFFN